MKAYLMTSDRGQGFIDIHGRNINLICDSDWESDLEY